GGSRGREDAGATRARELNGGGADAARAAVHEDRFAGGEPPAVEDVGPHGEERFGDRGRRVEVETARRRQTLRRGCGAVLRVAAARDERADGVADPPA